MMMLIFNNGWCGSTTYPRKEKKRKDVDLQEFALCNKKLPRKSYILRQMH